MDTAPNAAVAPNAARTHHYRAGLGWPLTLGLAQDCRAYVTLPFPLYDLLKICSVRSPPAWKLQREGRIAGTHHGANAARTASGSAAALSVTDARGQSLGR
jgi:hypothetical protein